MFVSIKIIKLFHQFNIYELIIVISCKGLCFKTDKYAAHSSHKQKIVKIYELYLTPRSAAVLTERPTFSHYICIFE